MRMTPRVLLVEDDDERAEWMGRELAGLTLERAPDSAHALAALEGGPAYDVIMLDYDIDPGGGGGHHVVAHLQQRSDPAVIVVHSANPLGGPWMAFALKRAGYDTTYAPVFDPESPETWRSILGGQPVRGGWGCPASHPALSLSKKECPLCVLAPKTHWYYEDDQCVLLDCLTCGSPMVVSKHHDEWTEDELADLIELATEGFPDLQPRLRRGSIPDHPHFHMEERGSNPNIQAMGMCFPFAYQKADEWFEAHFTKGGPGRRMKRHPDLNDKSKFKVVHGTVIDKWESPPKAVVHGWVEMGDMVFDAQTQVTKPDGIPRDVYYDMFQPEPYAEFTAEEAVLNCALRGGGEGPWDEDLAAMLRERDAWMDEGRSPNPRSSLTPQAVQKLQKRFRKGVKLWRGVGGPPRDPGDLGIGTYYSSYKARARQYARPDLITETVRLDAPLVLGDEDAYTQIADRYGTVRGPARTRGAIQATVDMIEAGHDGLVSVNTLTGGLEVVVFPALEEIVWP